ncbi:MAG: hypothetical protein Q4A42_00255 [Tissierellia bacterium]|nr:hypothetical protein [Tissierellia bacterium]
MKKIDSLDKLLRIKEEMKSKIAPRELGNLHKDQVIEVKVYGNGSETYDEVKGLFAELSEFAKEKGYSNLRLKFKDNINQKEKYIVDISSKIRATGEDEQFDKEEIVALIESIADLINSRKVSKRLQL